MPTVYVNGADLYYESAGSGPVLLFVHGMCGNAGVWADQVRRLSDRFRCVGYDRRGHTRSSLGDLQQRTVELHADDAAGFIEALGLPSCVYVGSSGGARIGVDVVRRYPHLLMGAVLSEPPIMALAPDGGREFMALVRPNIEKAIATGGPRAAVDAFFELACPGLWSRLDERQKEPYRANHAELLGDLSMPPYQIGDEHLATIRVPCMIIAGRDSDPTLRAIANRVAVHIRGAEFLELANCGHVTYAEQPEAFAESVRRFAEKLFAS